MRVTLIIISCDPWEVWDPFSRLCREIYCASDDVVFRFVAENVRKSISTKIIFITSGARATRITWQSEGLYDNDADDVMMISADLVCRTSRSPARTSRWTWPWRWESQTPPTPSTTSSSSFFKRCQTCWQPTWCSVQIGLMTWVSSMKTRRDRRGE